MKMRTNITPELFAEFQGLVDAALEELEQGVVLVVTNEGDHINIKDSKGLIDKCIDIKFVCKEKELTYKDDEYEWSADGVEDLVHEIFIDILEAEGNNLEDELEVFGDWRDEEDWDEDEVDPILSVRDFVGVLECSGLQVSSLYFNISPNNLEVSCGHITCLRIEDAIDQQVDDRLRHFSTDVKVRVARINGIWESGNNSGAIASEVLANAVVDKYIAAYKDAANKLSTQKPTLIDRIKKFFGG